MESAASNRKTWSEFVTRDYLSKGVELLWRTVSFVPIL
jgi:hypothetical protein